MTRYEIMKDFNSKGDLFKVNEKPVGISLIIRNDDEFTILTFTFNTLEYGNYEGNDFGPMFYNMIEKEAKEKGCKKIIADNCEIKTLWFWKKMSFTKVNETSDGYPIMRKQL